MMQIFSFETFLFPRDVLSYKTKNAIKNALLFKNYTALNAMEH